MQPITAVASALALYVALASARTDLTGCTRTDVSSPAGASYAWYVPGTGELCDFLDCGGGRAPPKYNVPGCPQYTGTDTYSPSFLAGFGAATSAASAAVATSSAAVVSTSVEAVSTSYATAHAEASQTSLVIPTTSSGFDTTITGSATLSVAASDKPLICALQASSDPNCGVSVSTTTYSTSTSISTIATGNGQGSSAVAVVGASQSTITSSASRSSSASASQSGLSTSTSSRATSSGSRTSSAVAASTGAADMNVVVSGLSLLAVAMGAVVVL